MVVEPGHGFELQELHVSGWIVIYATVLLPRKMIVEK